MDPKISKIMDLLSNEVTFMLGAEIAKRENIMFNGYLILKSESGIVQGVSIRGMLRFNNDMVTIDQASRKYYPRFEYNRILCVKFDGCDNKSF